MAILPQPPNICCHSNTAADALGTTTTAPVPPPLQADLSGLPVMEYPLLHFARIRFPAAVDLPETTAANDSVNAEVVHGELEGARRRWG